jgi:rhomboid protease GluP
MNSVPPNVSGQTNPQPQAARVPISFRLNKSKPWVTYVILIVTVLIYVIQYVSLLLTNNQYDIPAALGEKVNELILAGQVWRLITPILLHASILHVGFNMYALFVLGPGLEQYYGHRRYLLLYLIGGYAGNVLSFLLSPNPSLGASTAIFALVAAEIVFIYRNRMLFGSRARGMLLNMGVIVVVNLLLGLQPGIDNWGHLGGLIAGLIFGWVAGPHYQVQQTLTGLELKDIHSKNEVLWGTLLSAGLFTAIVIGRFLAG